ncbi:carbon-nitrogen hydrolase family protein [Sulfurimonas sp. C5]|uniref:carbon-nitrogen hydrolase family protein n=1 Tax=Sulfurimonas sp. C5 TaxID=3036947 RepID=UPI002453EB8B|nr:carbon-nitrogen hydrolase family protein [Sulfurimonas sp. C5]MDH4943535.1 carbon-nitrogen hydrolase family protein [Sulfurimonas sp. C5]
MKAAVLQLSSQGLSSTKLLNYIRIANKKGVKLLLLGEYILNPFFKELTSMSIGMIKDQSSQQIKILKDLSSTYEITIIAPIVLVKKKKLYKAIAKFAPNSTSYYQQQILINYTHWNEEKFFANEIEKLKAPLTFKIDDLKFAVINGFELHFDEIFKKLKNKNVDCILMPSVSTFDSYERWKALITTRAFTNNSYILRANRIGEYQDGDFSWKFYGDSVLASPNGEILSHLGNKEELMIVDLFHKEVVSARRAWGFRDAIKKREKLI